MQALKIAFLWHHHQPNYFQPDQNIFILPWVRFHALKDYYDLAAILDDYPQIHQTFNLVPSLVAQLEDYIHDRVQDRILILTQKKAAELSENERVDLLKYFFQLNHSTMVDIYPGYRTLLKKRGRQWNDTNLQRALERFTDQNYLDLQVWYNLSWVGELHKSISPFKELIAKDHGFSEKEKHTLLQAEKEILKKIIPKYRELEQRGQIEISTTPFYHPILPLLCDSDIARISQPDIPLPEHRFRFSEDAEEQIQWAIEFHTDRFGTPPNGMWPSEGSVSEQVVELFARSRISWIATDEEILFNSWRVMQAHQKYSRENLYFPWKYQTKNGSITIFFRDHELSDRIGFVYQNWEAEKAASDFVARLLRIRESITKKYGPSGLKNCIVSIILDGENCWEYYPNNGKDFLQALYHRLTLSSEIRTVTFREFLQNKPSFRKLEKIFPGSWINHNFAIWIGHPEDNTAWDYLYHARNALQQAEKEKNIAPEHIQAAKNEIFIAEGSDWCWWYGDEHSTENAFEFDQLFRSHLAHAYEFLNKEIPKQLFEPIRKGTPGKLVLSEPIGFISPVIDGFESNYFEWMSAGVLDTNRQGAAMHQMEKLVESIYFGFDLTNLYLRIVLDNNRIQAELDRVEVEISFWEPISLKCRVNLGELFKVDSSEEIYLEQNERWQRKKNGIKAAYKKFLELQIPFQTIHGSEGDLVKFQVLLLKDEQKLESWPRNEFLSLQVPGPDFEQIEWIV